MELRRQPTLSTGWDTRISIGERQLQKSPFCNVWRKLKKSTLGPCLTWAQNNGTEIFGCGGAVENRIAVFAYSAPNTCNIYTCRVAGRRLIYRHRDIEAGSS